MFVHEFADDLYGWEAQLRYFSRRYRCIAFNARGYPPSGVPRSLSKYSKEIATDDIANVMRPSMYEQPTSSAALWAVTRHYTSGCATRLWRCH